MELLGSELVAETIDSVPLYLSSSSSDTVPDAARELQLLPAFDEFLVSYKDRSPSLAPDLARIAIIGNGIFNPVISQRSFLGRMTGSIRTIPEKSCGY